MNHPSFLAEDALLAECKISFSRASGPGGQNRNKVETMVTLEHLPTGIAASANERRTQGENRKVAVQRLRCKLAIEAPNEQLVSAMREPQWTSTNWENYCRKGRIQISDTNEAFPSMLAELMAAIEIADWELPVAAERLATSSSQLIKLLATYPPALSRLNAIRSSRGKHPLRTT